MAAIREILDELTAPAALYQTLDGERLRCVACAHRCEIAEGAAGACKVRFNQGGVLRAPFGYVAGCGCDPVEKKPFFHVRPGSLALSFGMLGCNFHCGYCQNWVSSQALRDPHSIVQPHRTTPEQLIETALSRNAEIVVSTYNEPLITSEWAVSVFKKAKAAGLTTGFVSNGYGAPEALRFLQPWLDLCKVDLKTYDDRRYRALGGRLQPVLETIRGLYNMGVWIEIVTLLVSGFNDSREELTGLTEFIAGISVDIPWHVTAFHQNYKMTRPRNTTPEDLLEAAEIGEKSGLRYVYAGNLPGRAGKWENTRCPRCKSLLVERYGYRILQYNLSSGGRCQSCHLEIPGRWPESFRPQAADHPFSLL